MSLLEVVLLTSLLLIFVPQFALYTWHIILAIRAFRKRAARSDLPGLSVDKGISFVIPIRKEPLEYIIESAKYIHSLGLKKYEIIVVSDDDEDFKNKLFELIKGMREKGINIWLLWRSIPRGFRTGALNDGLNASTYEYVYILDVDSRPEKCLIETGINILESDPKTTGVVGRWEALNKGTRISQALDLGLRYLARILYRARSMNGSYIYPLGTGTLFNSHVLKKEMKGWDEQRIQDDMEIGARLMNKGYVVKYLDECAVYVENPNTYKAFRVQQSRWAYGAMDALISRLNAILTSPFPILIKIDAVLYLMQYLPQSLVFLGSTLLGFISIIYLDEPIYAVFLFVIWVLITSIYGLLMKETSESKESSWGYLVNSGRLVAITTAVSPYVLYSTIKALMRIKETYRRTPKGIFEKVKGKTRIPWELIIGIYFVFTGFYTLVNGLRFISLWLILNGICYIYIVVRFFHDVFYS